MFRNKLTDDFILKKLPEGLNSRTGELQHCLYANGTLINDLQKHTLITCVLILLKFKRIIFCSSYQVQYILKGVYLIGKCQKK